MARIAWGRETLEPSLPSVQEARLLDQDRRQPVLLLTLVSFSEDDVPVEYCRSLVRGDRARYHLETRRVHTSRSFTARRTSQTRSGEDDQR